MQNKHKKYVFSLQWLCLLVLCFGFNFTLQAQLPNLGGGTGGGVGNIGRGGGGSSGSASIPILQKDTLNIDARYDTILFTTNRYTLQLEKIDTSIAQIHRYHPALNQGDFPYTHLGNVGQPHQPLMFDYQRKIGFNLGLRQFDAYQSEHEEVPYYQSQHPFSQIQYNIGPDEEQNFQVDFGLHPAKSLHLYLRYRSANVAGIYQRQKGNYRNFTGSIWYKHPKKRYQLLAHYLTNFVSSEQNGGVVDDATVTEENQNKSFLSVNLSAAENEIRRKGIFIQQTMDFGRRVKQKVSVAQPSSNRSPFSPLEEKHPPISPQKTRETLPPNHPSLPSLEEKHPPISPQKTQETLPSNHPPSSPLEEKHPPISPQKTQETLPSNRPPSSPLEEKHPPISPQKTQEVLPSNRPSLPSLEEKKTPMLPLKVRAELPDSLAFPPLPKDSLQDSTVREQMTTALLQDSLRSKPKRKVIEKFIPRGRVGYTFRSSQNYYLYDDQQSVESASVYYNAFYSGDETNFDSRPALLYNPLREKTLENEVFLMWIGDKQKKGKKIIRNARAGLVHQVSRLTQAMMSSENNGEIDTMTTMPDFTTGLLNFQVENEVQKSNRQLSYLLKAEYALFGKFNVGDFNGEASIDYPIAPKLGNLQLKGSIKNLTPDYVQNRWFGHYFNWENDFKKTRSLQLAAIYDNPEWQLEVSARTQIFDQFIVWDNLSLPSQLPTEFSVNQFVVKKGFRFLRKFQLDHTSAVQISSSDFVRVPSYWTFNSLYYQGWVFKKAAFVRLGVDVYYNTNYFANAYNPATGQFFLQNEKELQFYPVMDAYLNAKIQRIRIFVKMQHLNQALFSGINNGYFDVLHYPMPDRALKFGVKWMFFD